MKNRLWLVSVTGGILSALAWHDKATGLIMLGALLPFLYIFQYSMNEKAGPGLVFIRVLPGFILYNLFTILWLRNASWTGAVYAVTVNAFLMSSVFWIASAIYKRSSLFMGYTSIVSFWIIFEHINSRVSILTPWLNLGNVLGNEIMFIQWYDVTGVAGGSLWILLCNLAVFFLIFRRNKRPASLSRPLLTLLLLFLIPPAVSIFKYINTDIEGKKSEFLIIQPNIDPYTAKFSGPTFEKQLQKMLNMADNNISQGTDWIILPETAVDDPFYEEDVLDNNYYRMIDSLLAGVDSISLVTGITTMRSVHSAGSSDNFFEVYNTAMQVNPDSDVHFYHKSKLVPGIEKKIRILPRFVEDMLIPDLGGTATGYGTQDERSVFIHPDGEVRGAPVICYESVYGDFVTGYIRKGANVIIIITNDGWWKNTAGYRQHLMFTRIRAIENRRPVVRAANTGISCFTDRKGNITSRTEWWEEGVLRDSVRINNDMSFYSLHGDFISRYMSVFGVFILIITFIGAPLQRLRYYQKFR